MRRLLAPLLFFCAVSAQAQHPPARLSELVDAAWQRESRARLLDARRAELAALAEVAAGSLPGPGTVGLSHRNDRLQSDRGRLEWELEYAQPLWLPGQAEARRQEADTALRALAAERAALRLGLARSLSGELLAWQSARAGVRLAEDRLALARALSDDLARRLRAGEAPRFDANLAESERLAAEAQLAEQGLLVAEAARRFERLTGTPPPETLPRPPATGPDEHPTVAAAREGAALARARLAGTRRSLRDNPELGVRLRHERDTFGAPFGDSVALRISIPLASAPRSAAREAAAIAVVTETAVALERTRDQLQLDLAQAADQLAAADRLLAAAEARRRLATDNVALADKAWRLGERPLEALLRARAAAFDADAALLRAGLARDQALAWRDYLNGAIE
ncbi:MAG: TolC family protein [Zoogloea sp.]|uniref:TolC family protein n=1 Tax=Zoogloea sp. TaxID=49181 RepID=UPI002613CF98|nr:TolC family protein [Zoogloea sp.]MDD3327241.1 TolC family protein [Zoogloea sp.]